MFYLIRNVITTLPGHQTQFVILKNYSKTALAKETQYSQDDTESERQKSTINAQLQKYFGIHFKKSQTSHRFSRAFFNLKNFTKKCAIQKKLPKKENKSKILKSNIRRLMKQSKAKCFNNSCS